MYNVTEQKQGIDQLKNVTTYLEKRHQITKRNITFMFIDYT